MKEQFSYNGKKIELDVLQVVDKNGRPMNEKIVAVNATDIILSPEVSTGLRDHIASAYPNFRTVYYHVWSDDANMTHYSAVLEDDHPELNVQPEVLSRYSATLEMLRHTQLPLRGSR